jgi:hypothetical protein
MCVCGARGGEGKEERAERPRRGGQRQRHCRARAHSPAHTHAPRRIVRKSLCTWKDSESSGQPSRSASRYAIKWLPEPSRDTATRMLQPASPLCAAARAPTSASVRSALSGAVTTSHRSGDATKPPA